MVAVCGSHYGEDIGGWVAVIRAKPNPFAPIYNLPDDTRNVSRYTWKTMIKGFAHKGLKQFFETGSKAGIQPKDAERLRLILTVLIPRSRQRIWDYLDSICIH